VRWLWWAAVLCVVRFAAIAGFGEVMAVLVAAQLLHAVTFAAQHAACTAQLGAFFPGRLRAAGRRSMQCWATVYRACWAAWEEGPSPNTWVLKPSSGRRPLQPCWPWVARIISRVISAIRSEAHRTAEAGYKPSAPGVSAARP